MIRAILFDFGGVLAEEGFREGLKTLARAQGLDPEKLFQEGMDAVYASGYVLGKGTEEDFWSLLKARTGLKGENQALREVVLSRFTLRPSMLSLVDELRGKGYIVGILSDQTDWLDAIDRETGLFRHFDRVFVSYRLGKGKRDPTLFDDVVRALGLAPQEVLFVDDNPENVARARSRGLKAILFTDEAELRRTLEALL